MSGVLQNFHNTQLYFYSHIAGTGLTCKYRTSKLDALKSWRSQYFCSMMTEGENLSREILVAEVLDKRGEPHYTLTKTIMVRQSSFRV